jgi:hypothetical protein
MGKARLRLQAADGDSVAPGLSDAEQVRRIEHMPKEVGVLLIVAGIGGILLPGPVGSPFLVLGAVVLWPRAFRGVEALFEKRFPKFHHQSMRQITRFLDDLEKRYPFEG